MSELKIRMDLRWFDNTQTTLLNQPGNDLSPEMKTYYEKRLIDLAEPSLVYDQFGVKRPIPRNGGKTIEFRKYSPLDKALTALTEGVTPHGNKLDVTTITATVDQYGDYIEISDVLDLTAIDRNVEEATSLLGSQAGRTLDTIVREVVTAGTNKMFAPKVSSTGTETEVLLRDDLDTTCLLTPKVIRQAVAKLRRMNAVPFSDGYFVGIIHPDVACDLQNDKEWQESHKYAEPENLYNGEIGRIGGVRFVQSTEAKIIGCTVRSTVAEATTTSTTFKLATKPSAAGEKYLSTSGNTITVGGTQHTVNSYAPDTLTVTLSAAASLTQGAEVLSEDAGEDGLAIYCTMIVAQNAYGVTEIEGGGLQHIIKQLGSAGTADPLNQRSTTGWKAMLTAERLVEEYMVRIEHASASNPYADAN